jgi:hypothetical protein
MHKKLESMYICSISSGLVKGEWNLFLLFSNGYVWFESKIKIKKKSWYILQEENLLINPLIIYIFIKC